MHDHESPSSDASTVSFDSEPTPPTPECRGLSATYDPADNKLRLRSVSRLPPDLYQRVRAAGFIWAPRQELFVAPSWAPEREDLLLELCGEIGDEDTSLVDRAEDRAERFEGYSERRADDAERARAAVAEIADQIPFGQPILVGHHSEKHARRDAEKIRSGMRRAVSMWETSKYWTARAAGALRLAKYKDRPDVRHRRIKGLEAERRRHDNARRYSSTCLVDWMKLNMTVEHAKVLANHDRCLPFGTWGALRDGTMTPAAAAEIAISAHETRIAAADRWIAHLDNRLAYERALLEEAGGATGGAFDPSTVEVGGRVLLGFPWAGWHMVTRVVKKDGAVVSVRAGRAGVRGIEECRDYKAPTEEEAATAKAAVKKPPMVNRPSDGARVLTKAEWATIHKDYKGSRVAKATEEHGAYRYRTVVYRSELVPVFLSDAKVDALPPPAAPRPELPPAIPVLRERAARPAPEPTVYDAMKESLRSGAGVQVVVADQLFPTPESIADRVIAAAGIEPHHRVLEPSAGTGALVRAIQRAARHGVEPHITCVEINTKLAAAIPYAHGAICRDFLDLRPCDLGELFDRVAMNPPFSGGADVDHVTHALGFLVPGGRLVAVMGAGVRFRQDRKYAAFRELVERHGGTIEDLPEDAFAASGTSVRTVLVTVEAR